MLRFRNAGANRTIVVQFLPTVVGSNTGTLTLTHNATGSSSTIHLSGTGVAPAAPVITLNTTSLNFANVQINQSKDLTAVIGNIGNTNLEISSITITGTHASLFIVVDNSTNIIVIPSASHTATVRFTPNETGAKSATLRILSNVEERTVTLSGNAVIAVNEPEDIMGNGGTYLSQSIPTQLD